MFFRKIFGQDEIKLEGKYLLCRIFRTYQLKCLSVSLKHLFQLDSSCSIRFPFVYFLIFVTASKPYKHSLSFKSLSEVVSVMVEISLLCCFSPLASLQKALFNQIGR